MCSAKAACGTTPAMVGTLASCQPKPVLMSIGAGANDLLCDPHSLVPRQAALDEVEDGVAIDDEEAGAEGRAYAGDDGDRKARAVLERAAPAVGAVVGAAAPGTG